MMLFPALLALSAPLSIAPLLAKALATLRPPPATSLLGLPLSGSLASSLRSMLRFLYGPLPRLPLLAKALVASPLP